MSKLILWLIPIFTLIWLLSAPWALAVNTNPQEDYCISNKITGAYIDSSGQNLIVEYSGTNTTPTSLNIQQIDNIEVNASSNQAVNMGGGIWAFKMSSYELTKKPFDSLIAKSSTSSKTQVNIDYSSSLRKPDNEPVRCTAQSSDVQLAKISSRLEQKVNEAIQQQAQVPGAAASPNIPPAPGSASSPALRSTSSKPCDPNDKAAKALFGPCPAGIGEFEEIFSKIITVIAGIAFVVMLIMLIWGGIKYLTSGGEPKAIQSAHYTVTWALLGVLFMAVAWLILQLIRIFTGINVTIFNIRVLM